MTVEEIKKEIEKVEKKLSNPLLPDFSKQRNEKKLKDLKAKLAEAEGDKKPAAKKAPAKKPAAKKTPAKKTTQKKAAKKTTDKKTTRKPRAKKTTPVKDDKAGRKFIMFGNKKYYEDDKEYCEVLVKLYKKRRAAAKKAGETKTRSITSRVSDRVSSAVKSAVDSIPKKDLESKPKTVLTKIERVDKAAHELVEALVELSGKKANKTEMKKEFEPLQEMIKKLKERYAK